MDRVVIGWLVLELTNSAWDLALIEALRWIALMMFGIAGGAVADRIDRRWVLIGAQALAMLVCGASALLLAIDRFNFSVAAVATFLLGLQWAVDWPTRRALIPDLVGRERTVSAVALDNVSTNLTRVVGPLVAGALIAYLSASVAFLFMAGLYLLEITLLARMPVVIHGRQVGTTSMLRYLTEGFDRIRESQPIVGVLLVSAAMNILLLPYQQLLPVFARDELHVDAVGLGALSAAAGVGSLVGALALASAPRVSRKGFYFSSGSSLMCIFLAGFAVSRDFAVALVLLVLTGLGHAAFGSLQTTIVLTTATDQLRGRALGALTLAIGCTPIGSLEMGAVAVALGAPAAVVVNAALCAASVVLIAVRLPRFRNTD